jgi:hypothetical protein
MKRGTKFTVFVASMALTVAGLFAFVGPRHCYGRYHHGYAYEKYHQGGCGQWDKAENTGNTQTTEPR